MRQILLSTAMPYSLLNFRGTSGIDIDLQFLDINQCDDLDKENGDSEYEQEKTKNVFAGSHRCPNHTHVSILATIV